MRTTLPRVVLAIIMFGTLAAIAAAEPPKVEIKQTEQTIEVTIDGKPFTTYRFVAAADDPTFHRPYFWPVLSADGIELTSDQTRLMQKQKTDHPWHRSVWVGQGDVNGLDHWTHKNKKQVHLEFTKVEKDGFVEKLAWEGKEAGAPLLNELRTVKFVAYSDGARGIDLTSTFTAASGEVVFKVNPLNGNKGVEAGWLACRVSPKLSADKAKIQITSSAPASTEKDARTKPATWCDLTAPIDGQLFGVALFDHPENPGHPAPFHIRSFGFISHIGVHDWTLGAKSIKTFRHRLLFHSGDAKSANLDQRYQEFVKP